MLKFFRGDINTTIWKYYAFTFLRDFSFFSAVLFPFLTDWGKVAQSQVLILQSWFMFWIFVLEIPTGVIADKLGRKYLLAMGAIVVTFAALLYGSIPKFEVFLLAEFLFAAALALTSGADRALLYDALKEVGREEESKNIFGKAHAFTLSGILIGAPIGSLIAAKFGLNAPMLFSAVPYLLAAVIAYSIKEPKLHGKVLESRRYLDIARDGIRFFYNHKALRLIAFDAIVVASTAYFVIWLYQLILKSINVPIFYFGFIHALFVGAEIIIAANFVRLEKLFGSGRAFLRFTAFITGAAFIVVAIWPNIFTLLLFVILAGGFGLTRLELMGSYMNRLIPSESRATVLSSISMFRRFALVLLNPLVGILIDRSLGLALFLIGLLPLAVFLFSPLKQDMLEGESKEE